MHRSLCLALGYVMLGNAAWGAAKPHVIAFGKWTTIQLPADADDSEVADTKARALYIDGKLKEFTLGTPHEITDRLFVVRRAFRLNDSLPQESSGPRWRWQRGGWLLVDRATGHVAAVSLPEFDTDNSAASWYRDYVAYCGVSDDGKKTFTIVMQLGRRKPILKQLWKEAREETDTGCAPPDWQRQPVRVTFAAAEGKKVSYAIHGHAVDMVTEESEPEEGAQ